MENGAENPASWWLRAIAAILDFLPATIAGATAFILLFAVSMETAFGIEDADDAGANVNLILIAVLVLLLGYMVWWMSRARKSADPWQADSGHPRRQRQTPDSRLDWGMMFVREFVIKWLLG